MTQANACGRSYFKVVTVQEQKLKTGTTTVGIKCKDCVIVAAESKSTMGGLVASKTAEKVFQIDDRIAVTIAGGSGDAQNIVRVLKAEINLYRLSRSKSISMNAVTSLLSNILQGNRYYPYMTMLIIGGYDETGGHIYSIDPVGGLEEDDFTSTGSGSPIAFGVLENEYKEGLSKDDGIRLVVRAIRAARERDIFSGGYNINVAVIDKSGVRFVEKAKIQEIAK